MVAEVSSRAHVVYTPSFPSSIRGRHFFVNSLCCSTIPCLPSDTFGFPFDPAPRSCRLLSCWPENFAPSSYILSEHALLLKRVSICPDYSLFPWPGFDLPFRSHYMFVSGVGPFSRVRCRALGHRHLGETAFFCVLRNVR